MKNVFGLISNFQCNISIFPLILHMEVKRERRARWGQFPVLGERKNRPFPTKIMGAENTSKRLSPRKRERHLRRDPLWLVNSLPPWPARTVTYPDDHLPGHHRPGCPGDVTFQSLDSRLAWPLARVNYTRHLLSSMETSERVNWKF